MLLRNDTDVPLHIPPSDSGPSALVQPGDDIDYPCHVAGLTPVDDGPRDDDGQAATAKPTKAPVKPKQTGPAGDDSEGVTP